MGCISYATPLFNKQDAVSFNNFIDEFDKNMILAGFTRNTMVDVAEDIFTLSNPVVHYNKSTFEAFYNAFVIKSTIENQYFFSLYYNVPVGDNSVVYENDPVVPEFKRIKTASYDNTPITIKIHFMWQHHHKYETSIAANKFFKCIIPYVIVTNNTTKVSSPTCATTFTYLDMAGSPSSYYVNYTMKGNSYIALTNKSISISMGCHQLTGVISQYDTYDRYMIQISIYRDNGSISVFGNNISVLLRGGPAMTSYPNSNMRLLQFNNISNTVTSINNSGNNFLFWPNSAIGVSSNNGNNINYGKVFSGGGINGAPVKEIPYFTVTKKVDTTISMIDYIYTYNGNYIIGNVLNLGLTERAQTPVTTGLTYSWAYLFEPTIVYTTAHVGP